MGNEPNMGSIAATTATAVTSSYLAPTASTVTSHINSLSPSSSFYDSTTTALGRFIPSFAQRLLLLPLHIIYQAEVFAFVTAPRYMVHLLGLDGAMAAVVDNLAGPAQEGGAAAAAGAGGVPLEGVAEMVEGGTPWNLADIIQNMRRFSGFFSYMTSRWSLACFSVVCYALDRGQPGGLPSGRRA
jgi:hypothetical protein